ncbi:glycine-rich domain-containing protein [Azospirillum halopraeferens]|uniref:glycine-rich domain-containing protein n=1 Tax=Azospirillum halopraeferens TaxID=34010 RepID=UPI0004073D3C|nr:hypothetical protein [Azospirillum halopraeferens]
MAIMDYNAQAASERVATMDFTFLARRLETIGETAETSAEAVSLYRQFLQLHAENPQQPLVPPQAADRAWHEHILYTRRYDADMKALFGHSVHHVPDVEDASTYEAAVAFTREAFKGRFGVDMKAGDFAMCIRASDFAMCILTADERVAA